MDLAIRSFQKRLFVILLWASGFSGVVADLTFEGSKTALYAAYDGLILLLALLSLSHLRGGLKTIMLLIITGIIFNLTYSQAAIQTSLNGMREILMILGIICFYSKVFEDGNEEEAMEYIAIMRRFIVYFLILQIPVAFIQFLKYGPTDFVGGTYGSFNGGALTVIIVCMVFFMFQFPLTAVQKLLLYVSLVPLFLNETKISFILIPMMIIFIYFEPRIKNLFLALLGGGMFLLIFDKLYTHSNLSFEDNISGIFSMDFLEDYLMADIYAYDDVPRLTRIIIGWNMLSQETKTLFFGFEYGLFRGGSLETTSHFAQTYSWLLEGTRPYLFYLMMQGGVFLVTMWMMMIAQINKYFRNSNKFIIFYLVVFLVTLIYQDSFRHHNFSIVYFFAVFFGNSRLYKNKSVTA